MSQIKNRFSQIVKLWNFDSFEQPISLHSFILFTWDFKHYIMIYAWLPLGPGHGFFIEFPHATRIVFCTLDWEDELNVVLIHNL